MKKLMSIFILCICVIISGCGSNNKSIKYDSTINKATSSEDNNESVQELKLNEPFKVTTEYGDYEITITGLTNTDWYMEEYNNNDKKVVLLSYEINNISFKNDNYPGVLVDSDAFKVVDNNGYLNTDVFYGGDYTYPEEVPVGTKFKCGIAYAIDPNVTSLNFTFCRDVDVASIKFEL